MGISNECHLSLPICFTKASLCTSPAGENAILFGSDDAVKDGASQWRTGVKYYID